MKPTYEELVQKMLNARRWIELQDYSRAWNALYLPPEVYPTHAKGKAE